MSFKPRKRSRLSEASIDYVTPQLYRAALRGMREVNKPHKQRKPIEFTTPVTGGKTTADMIGLPRLAQKMGIAGLAAPLKDRGGTVLIPKDKQPGSRFQKLKDKIKKVTRRPVTPSLKDFSRRQAAAHEFVHLADTRGMGAQKAAAQRDIAKRGTGAVLRDRIKMFRGIAQRDPVAMQAYTQNPREIHAYSAIAGTLGVRREKKKGTPRAVMMHALRSDNFGHAAFSRNAALNTMAGVKRMSAEAGGKGNKYVQRKFAKEMYKGIERAYPEHKPTFSTGMARATHKPKLPESRRELTYNILQEVFKGRVWSTVDKHGTETVGQKTQRTHKDSDVPNPGNKKNAVTTVSTTGRPDKRYPSHMRPDEMKATKNEEFAMRDAFIGAIIEAMYTPPPGMKPVKDKDWYSGKRGIYRTKQDNAERAREINNQLYQIAYDQTPEYGGKDPILTQVAAPKEMEKVVRSVGRKYLRRYHAAAKAREGLLFHQARKAGYKPDPKEIKSQATLMMPSSWMGGEPAGGRAVSDVHGRGQGFDPTYAVGDLRQAAQERLRSQRMKRRMEKRGLQYTPAKKARVTRQMNRNRAGRRGHLPEWLEEAKQSRVNKAILKARKFGEKFVRKMEGKKLKKANDNERS
jgi:hypothetical protein